MLGMYACALVYTQRAGMSVAIVAMTTTTASRLQQSARVSTGQQECENPSSVRNHSHQLTVRLADDYEQSSPEFDWNEKLQVL